MKKQYHIENLDCAHCAMQMEEEAKKVPGVISLRIHFVSMKMTLEANDDEFHSVFRKVQAACKKVEPDVKFSGDGLSLSAIQWQELGKILFALILFIAAKIPAEKEVFSEKILLLSFLPAYLLAGFGVIRKAFLGLFHKKLFDENFLMTLATFGAFVIGEASEGVMVMLLYRIGEFLQNLAVSKSRRRITDLMDIRPDGANLIQGDQILRKKPEEVPVGSRIVIKPGEKIPLDGVIEEGSSFLDTASLTGESVPKEVRAGDRVTSGCINMNGLLTVRTETEYKDSSVSKILALLEDSEKGKSKTENIISRFARIYTPVVVFLALFLACVPPLFTGDWGLWIHKAITCLVISCPCALVISVPLSFFSGIGSAGTCGILVKGAESMEKLAKAGVCAFDKTGTLTQGCFQVTAIHPEIISEEELLEIAATCENYSDHPISQSLKIAFNREIDKGKIGRIQETAGMGVEAEIDGTKYYVGNNLLMQKAAVSVHPCALCSHSGTVIHIASEKEYLGHIVISDRLRDDAKKAVEDLKKTGVHSLYLLSGDTETETRTIGDALGIEKIHAALLPQDKPKVLREIRKNTLKEETVLFVGDGMNDAPVLLEADLGIAMGSIGADAAMEAADVVLMDDKPSKIALGIRIAKKTLSIVWQNIAVSVGIKLFVLIPNIFLGEESVPIWLAVFADAGVCILAVLNATRALHTKK